MTKLVVGLGNPGKKYEKTRHNAGFIVLNQYIKQHNITMQTKDKFLGDVGVFGAQDNKPSFKTQHIYEFIWTVYIKAYPVL